MADNLIKKFRRLTGTGTEAKADEKPRQLPPQRISYQRRHFKPKAEIKGKGVIPYLEREEYDKETGMARVIRKPFGVTSVFQGTTPSLPSTASPRATQALGERSTGRRVPVKPMSADMPARMSRPVGPLRSMKSGGKVRKTGMYKLHAGETVKPAQSRKRHDKRGKNTMTSYYA